MPAVIQQSQEDYLAKLLRNERKRHGAVEVNLVGIITGLRKQITDLNVRLEETQTAYVMQVATTLRGKQ